MKRIVVVVGTLLLGIGAVMAQQDAVKNAQTYMKGNGKNAGVAVAIPNATSSPTEGSATLTDAQAADLMAGKYYVNIHTTANPGGEIRGQVTK